MKTKSFYSLLNTALGDILLVARGDDLTGVYFDGCKHVPGDREDWQFEPKQLVLIKAGVQIQEYFAGKRTEFSLPMRLAGTDFQESIWREIARIPFGETISYGELARRAGRPEAIRAAGASTGRNPISIIVPCHRVIGKKGDITGYAGTLPRKQHLLELERCVLI